jgi:hypothetical protein
MDRSETGRETCHSFATYILVESALRPLSADCERLCKRRRGTMQRVDTAIVESGGIQQRDLRLFGA